MAVWRPNSSFSPPIQAARSGAVADYLLAGSAGLLALLLTVPLSTISGRAGLWAHPGGDAAVTFAGHLAFQAPGWHWPLLLAPALVWPSGSSIALTDSNPLMSLAAKLVATWRGHPANLLGVWLAICWMLQPVGAVYALRGLRPAASGRPYGADSVVAVAILSLLCPAWLMRFLHINLLAHFLLLAALGLSFRMVRLSPRYPWWPACVLLTAAVLIHPYLYLFAAVVLAAPLLRRIVAQPREAWRPIAAYALSVGMPAAIFRLASGGFGADRGGYGYYSLNLLSPVWPQLSGLFGPTLPILDATGGQYEGFNYQGAGVLLLIAAALVAMAWQLIRHRRPPFPSAAGRVAMIIPLAVLTLVAATPNLFIGHAHVQVLAMSPWNRLFACIQSSGRAFWPVGYAMMIGSVAMLAATMPGLPRAILLAMAVLLQLIDTQPERIAGRRFFAGVDQPWAPFAMPAGARLLRVVPPCDQNYGVVDLLRLRAVQYGVRLGDMRMARTPVGYDCRAALAADLNTPLDAGELRFFLPASVPDLHPAVLGADVTCVHADPGILCSRVPKPAEPVVRPASG